MRRILLLILIAAAAPRAIRAQAPAAPAGSMREDLAALEALHPRLEGSPAERRTLQFIAARLAALGLEGKPFDFSDSDTAHSFSSCLRVEVPGARPDVVIVAVPLNHPRGVPAAEDGSVNIALALDLLAGIRGGTPPPVSVTVLFLGAEFGDTPRYPMGTRLFLEDPGTATHAAVLSLALRGVPARVLVRRGARGVVSPSWLVARSAQALTGAGMPMRVRGEEMQVYRLGLAEESALLEPWLAAGYPAVQLDGEDGTEGPGSAAAGTALALLSQSLRGFLDANAAGFPAEWDRHYLLFPTAGRPLIVAERTLVAVLLGTLLAALLYSLVFRKGLRRYARSLGRNLHLLVPILLLTFLFFLAGTGAVQAVLALRAFPRLWEEAPLAFLGLKIAVPLLLYAGLYRLLRRLPFPRGGSFYTAAALAVLLADTVVTAALDVSFSWYFLAAFLLVFLSALVPNRVGKLLLVLAAPAAMVSGLVRIFMIPALPFCRLVLLSPLQGNLLIAGIALPFVLSLLRIGLLFPGRGILRRGVREPVLAAVFAAAAGLLAARLLTFSPWSAGRPRPVSVVQTIDEREGTNTLAVSSPAPLGEIGVSDSLGDRLVHAPEAALTIALAAAPPSPPPQLTTGEFLGKTGVTLLLAPGESPRALEAVLSSGGDFILFDCTFPFVRESSREYRLLVGAFPPDPLALQLTLPAGGEFELTLSLVFDSPLRGVRVTAAGAEVGTRVRVVRRVVLRT